MRRHDTVSDGPNSKMIHFLFLVFCAYPGSGMPNSMQQNRHIIGGQNTNITEVPYQAALYRDGRFICGATIVSERHLLTAAHCIPGGNHEYSVRVGSSFREKDGVIHKVKNAVRHPSFSELPVDYDVAFLEVKDPIQFNANAQPIPVADTEPKGGDAAKISGYGRKDLVQLPQQLQSAEVLVLDKVRCKDIYDGKLSRTMICTISKDFKTCAYRGDSGGPMVVNGKVVGATSWGNPIWPCNYPTVFSNFADREIRRFIRENTGV